jgi:DNA-directed RNA polymerase subunit H
MVVGSNPSEPASYNYSGTDVEMKNTKEFSLLGHNMVPQHILIPENEVYKVLKKYAVDKEQLPKIKFADPVIVEIGAEIGDVIKVIRNSPTAGEAVVYRLVIE